MYLNTPSTSVSSMLALWVALIGVSGTLLASVLTQFFQIRQQRHKEDRDDALRAKEEQKNKEKEETFVQKAEEDERNKSDAACWAQIKLRLDEVYWNVHGIRPGAKPSPNGGGWMYDPFVDTAKEELLKDANSVLKALNSVSFFDSRSQQSLKRIMDEFQEIVRKAGESEYYRKQLQELHQSQYADVSTQANKKAIESLEEFDSLYKEITVLVRDYVGYHRIFQQ